MQTGAAIYEGKSKRVYATDDPALVVLEFKDDATAFNGQKKAQVTDKGRINCAISTHLLGQVEGSGVLTHLVRPLSATRVLARKVEVVPVEIVVRNVVAGSFARRYGLAEGQPLPWPLVECFAKSDALGDPLVVDEAVVALGWARRRELDWMKSQALVVNQVLQRIFGALKVDVIDFKLEFGRIDGNLVLADEITPDGMRLWARGTGQKLDKDVFRRDLGDLSATYHDLYQRLFGAPIGE